MISNDKRHYCIDGKLYPRITTILECLNRRDLNDWRAKVGYDAAEDWREETSTIGKEVHRLIAKIVNNSYSLGEFEFYQLAPEIRNGLRAWRQAQLSIPFEPVQSEILVYSEHGYAGTADCLAKIGKETWLLDWKCASQIYSLEVTLQLAAYYYAYPNQLAGCRAIRLDRDSGKWTPKDMLILEHTELEQAYEAFLSLKKVWDYVNKEVL